MNRTLFCRIYMNCPAAKHKCCRDCELQAYCQDKCKNCPTKCGKATYIHANVLGGARFEQ